MIIGTGIDMIEVERVATRVGRDTGFREMVFSKAEIEYCDSKADPFQHYAARFAAKEAFLKAIGRGWDSGLTLNEIEIVNETNGKPCIRISGKTEKDTCSIEYPHYSCISFSFKIHGNSHRHSGIMNHSPHKKFMTAKRDPGNTGKKTTGTACLSEIKFTLLPKNILNRRDRYSAGFKNWKTSNYYQRLLRKTCSHSMMNFFACPELQ